MCVVLCVQERTIFYIRSKLLVVEESRLCWVCVHVTQYCHILRTQSEPKLSIEAAMKLLT